MSSPPCLLVRHDPTHAQAASDEARAIMARIGEPGAIVRATHIPGTLKVIPEGSVHDAQRAISRLYRQEPGSFRRTTRWTVVDEWCRSELTDIRRAVAPYSRQIGASDSWRVDVHPLATGLHKQNVIDAVAPLIHNAPVDLEDPTKEIRIDILGDETAVGLIDRSETFRGRLDD